MDVVAGLRRPNTALPLNEVISLRTLLTVLVHFTLLILDGGRIAAQRVDVRILVAVPPVVAGESAMIRMDVRVTTGSIDLIVDRLAWAALSTATCDMSRADLG